MEAGAPGAADRKNSWLDLIRALAITLVLFRHGERALLAELGRDQNALQTVFMNGWIGVDLFFGLSGYLIARHLLHAGIGSPEFRLGRYVALRALRILPAYYAVLLLVVLGSFPLFEVAGDGLGWRVAYHLLFLQDYLPSDINVVFWSLGVEEKFYLLAPVLVLALLKCRSVNLALLGLAVLFALPSLCRFALYYPAAEQIDYAEFWAAFRSPFHMSLECLVAGVAVAMAEHAGLVRRCRRTGARMLAGSLTTLALWTASHDFMSSIGAVDVLVQPPLIALLVGGVLVGGVQLAGTPMPFRPTAGGIAKLSYSLYLIHFPLIPLAMAITLPFGITAFWLSYLCASFLAAALLYRAVERPFLDWKDELARRGRITASEPEAAISKA